MSQNTINLNLRDQPDTGAQILTQIPGTSVQVKVLATSQGWWQVEYNGHQGFAYSNNDFAYQGGIWLPLGGLFDC